MGAPGCQVFKVGGASIGSLQELLWHFRMSCVLFFSHEKLHVHDFLSLDGFVQTVPRQPPDVKCPGVFSLDCEMVTLTFISCCLAIKTCSFRINTREQLPKVRSCQIWCHMIFFFFFLLLSSKCYTIQGLELSRVTLVNSSLQVVYDTFVRPDNEVIDYNTR